MKKLIKQIIKEDFDWVTNDTVSFLVIGEPLTVHQPKKVYRLHMTHGTGEERGTWVPNYIDYDPRDNLDTLVRHIKILSYLNQNYESGLIGLAMLFVNDGETWVLSNDGIKELRDTVGEYDVERDAWVDDEGDVLDEGDIIDVIYDWLGEELRDYGITQYDSYHQDEATIEDWGVTYFDEFGVEHMVKVNLPQG